MFRGEATKELHSHCAALNHGLRLLTDLRDATCLQPQCTMFRGIVGGQLRTRQIRCSSTSCSKHPVQSLIPGRPNPLITSSWNLRVGVISDRNSGGTATKFPSCKTWHGTLSPKDDHGSRLFERLNAHLLFSVTKPCPLTHHSALQVHVEFDNTT